MDDRRIQKASRQWSLPHLIENEIDLFYLTHLRLSKGRLLVSKERAILFVDGRYYEKAKKEAPCEVARWEDQKEFFQKEICFDSAKTTCEAALQLQKSFEKVRFLPTPHPLKKLRAIKEEEEIEQIKKAARLTYEGFEYIASLLKEGITEEKLALEFEIYCRQKGAMRLSFEPIIAFGENSAYPHHRASSAKLKKDQIVLIDIGAVVNHYAADMTRVIHFGQVNERLHFFEEQVRKALQAAVAKIRVGEKIGMLDSVVKELFENASVKPLYMHGLGHGIGLETHEYPRLSNTGEDREDLLEPGMVFTIEPGLYQVGCGGVRLEEMVVVREQGFEWLLPKQSSVSR